MFDLHFTHILRNGLALYSQQTRFNQLFPTISQALQTKFYQLFMETQAKHPISIDLANTGKVQSLPMISIKLMEQAFETQGLGDLSDEKHFHLLTLQSVDITIYAQDQDLVRVLHAITHASFLQYKSALIKVGYDNLRFVSSTDMDQETTLNAESSSLVNFKRRLKFTAIHHMYLPTLTTSSDQELPIFVQIDQYGGDVTTYTK
jgi:hypothetical protein